MIEIYYQGYKTYYENEEEFCRYVPFRLYCKVKRQGLIGYVKDKSSSILDIKQWKVQQKIEKIYSQKRR